MPESFVEAFVDKLILLEEATGASVGYRVMPAFTVPFHDHLYLQKTAKDIAESIGLTGYTFIVAVAKQGEGTGGHIDLSSEGSAVFIEIDSEMMDFPDSVGATLCHEICHKWLQRHGIRSSIERDNEYLTDITCVYLGFGKTMLNGCHAENVRSETVPGGRQTITKTMRAGYLNRDQLAFVCCLVCAMRNIPLPDLMEGLNAEATQAVRRCCSSYGHHFAPRFHESEQSQQSIGELTRQVNQAQFVMAELDKHLTYVRASFCDTVHEFLKTRHRDLEALRRKAVAFGDDTSPDPALRFLHAISVECGIRRLSEQVALVSGEADGFLHQAREIGEHLSRNVERFPSPSPSMFNTVVCPNDGTRLKLPENSGDLIVTCPKCRYQFAYNTSVVSFPEPPAPRAVPDSPPPRRTSWWKRSRTR